jgi:hypothetical protein
MVTEGFMTKTFQKTVNGNTYEITKTKAPNGLVSYSQKLIQHRQHNYSMAVQPKEDDLTYLMFEDMVESLDEE